MASSSLTVYETLMDNDSICSETRWEITMLLSVTYTQPFSPLYPPKQRLITDQSPIPVHKYTHVHWFLATSVVISPCLLLLSELMKREGTRTESTQLSLRARPPFSFDGEDRLTTGFVLHTRYNERERISVTRKPGHFHFPYQTQSCRHQMSGAL